MEPRRLPRLEYSSHLCYLLQIWLVGAHGGAGVASAQAALTASASPACAPGARFSVKKASITRQLSARTTAAFDDASQGGNAWLQARGADTS
jgi:hypothetical protein